MNTQTVAPVKVSVQTAQHVLHHFGDTELGLEPGSFTSRLLLAISAADMENLELLRLGFPELVHAFLCVGREPWGLEWLRSKVKRGLVPDRSEPDLFEAAGEASGENTNRCLMRTVAGEPCAVHFDCDDYPDGTVTSVLTGKQVLS